jgi:hypothetical protein
LAERRKVTQSDIRAIIRSEILSADGQASSELSIERGQNMDYYQGRPFGNEVDGRSSVVDTAVRDTVEWILPTLVRIFCSGEDAVEFEPETADDVEKAKQATEYVNFIWNRDNKGFINTYSWFKDALISKNGRIKIWWDDTPRTKRERYTGLDDMAFTMLVNDPQVEVSEHTENKQTVEVMRPDKTGAITPQKVEFTTHDLVLTRKMTSGRVCVLPVPPEEFLISKDARDIETARFVGHRRRRFLSDLVEEGFDREQVERLSGDETSIQTDSEEIKRNTVEFVVPMSESAINPAMRQVWVTEGYIRIDEDGDGIAEMRKVVVAGAAYEILSDEAWDTPRPFADLTPIPMPHRYHGLCPADLVKDIQLIKSTIWRQYLDNMYLSNNQREEVVEANIIDPSEVLSSAPGRKIRVKAAGSVIPIMVPQIGDAALAGLEYIDQQRENRTGVSPRTQGLGADALHETAAGERIMLSQAMGKIELIARIFAETGVKDAFRLILKLICEYQDKARTIRLRDQWVDMDPSQWNSDMDMTATVGLGMGDRDQQMAHAITLGQFQAQAIPLGCVTYENLRNAAELGVQAMGLKGVDRFFTFPQGQQANQPIQLPGAANGGQAEMAKVQGQIQVEHTKAQGQIAVAQTKAQGQLQVEAAKHNANVQSTQQQNNQSAAVQMYTAQQKANLAAFEVQQTLALKEKQLELNHAIDASNAAVKQSMASEKA